MAEITMTLDEYEQLRAMALSSACVNCSAESSEPGKSKPKRKKSAYNRRYAAAFKKVQKKFKTKVQP